MNEWGKLARSKPNPKLAEAAKLKQKIEQLDKGHDDQYH